MLQRLPAPLTFVLLAISGGTIAVLILLYDSQATPQSAAYTRLPEFTVWLFLVVILSAITALLSPVLWRYIWQRTPFLLRQYKLLLAAALLFVLFLVPDTYSQMSHFGQLHLPLTYQREKIAIIVTATLILVSIPASLAIWLVQSDANTISSHTMITEIDVQSYLQLRDQLSTLTLAIGAYTGLAVLSVAALRASLVAANVTTAEDYPTILSLLYGAYFSFLLFLVYLPSQLTLNSLGSYIGDNFFKVPNPHTKNWKEEIDNRSALEGVLQANTTNQQNIVGNLALLSPIIGGIISILLSK